MKNKKELNFMSKESKKIVTNKTVSDELNRIEIDDPNHSQFNLGLLKEKLSEAQSDYNIRIAEGYNPNKRSAKRITIIVSTAYLTSGGSIHHVQDLESEIYKLCKEYHLDCDPLEMESEDRSYKCKKTGKTYKATHFDNHMVCPRNFSRDDIPLARAIIHYFTYHYYRKEDMKNGTRYYPGKGVVRISGYKQSNSLPIEERKKFTVCKPKSYTKNLFSRKIYGMGKSKLCN